MPTTFSSYFKLNKSQNELDFIDIIVGNGDTPLFIDPFTITNRTDRWSISCHNQIVNYFQLLLENIISENNEKAECMLHGLIEPNETCLGFSRKKVNGKGIGKIQAKQLFNALKESRAIKTGFIKDLEDCSLLIDGIDVDKISDITTNIIRDKLIEYTNNQCYLYNIPLRNVDSGMIWDSSQMCWKSEYKDLPIYKDKKILLVPKAITRGNLLLNSQKYYRDHVLEYLRNYELNASSSLVRTLKNGLKKVYIKDLEKQYPYSKDFLYEFSSNHPEELSKYKENLLATNRHKVIEMQVDDTVKEEGNKLIKKLKSIPYGNSKPTAPSDFHDLSISILVFLFHPYLVNPIKEKDLHDRRKRIDITFDNAATNGFFFTLSTIKNIPCSYIMIECKNYQSDPGNPELDQLSGRFSINRGKFGLLICRNFTDKDLFIKRCKDTATDGRGYILPLDDNDLIRMIEYKIENKEKYINDILEYYYKMIVF